METTIDLLPLADQVLAFLGALVMAFSTWALNKLSNKFGMEADEKMINRVREAVENGLKIGKQKIAEEYGEHLSFDVKYKVAAHAANYVLDQVPAVVKKLDYTPRQLENWALSKLEG